MTPQNQSVVVSSLRAEPHRRRLQDEMKKDGSAGIWEPGFSIFTNELAKEERTRLAPLQAELNVTTDEARKEDLKREIAMVKVEFKAKRRSARYGLFGKA